MTPWAIEIDRIDWSAHTCACGERGHLGDDLRTLIEARSLSEWDGASLDGHVEDPSSTVADVAVPATGVMMAALQEDLAPATRDEFMINLWRLVLADADDGVTQEIHPPVRRRPVVATQVATTGLRRVRCPAQTPAYECLPETKMLTP